MQLQHRCEEEAGEREQCSPIRDRFLLLNLAQVSRVGALQRKEQSQSNGPGESQSVPITKLLDGKSRPLFNN